MFTPYTRATNEFTTIYYLNSTNTLQFMDEIPINCDFFLLIENQNVISMV